MNISEEERSLLIGCFTGDRRAQRDFIIRYSDLVYRAVSHAFKAKSTDWRIQDIEDLHQTVLMRLLEKRCKRLRQFKGKNGCSLRSWVRMIAVRTVIDHFRQQKDALAHAIASTDGDAMHLFPAQLRDPLDLLDGAQQMDRVYHALDLLSPRDRLFIKLHILREMSIQEVAILLNVSVNTAYSIKHRALERLRNALVRLASESKANRKKKSQPIVHAR